jgi:phosphopantetheinyl transferase (holo-ACP synthase)
MAKRQKTYFTSREIAHTWAHQLAPHGKVSGGNQSFNGGRFYSYGTVIGNIIKYKGKKSFVLDTASFSSTTSGHQTQLRGAIPASEKTFYTSKGNRGQYLDFTPAILRDFYLAEYQDITPSKFAFNRASDLLSRLASLDKAIDVCAFFGLSVNRLLALRATCDNQKQLAEKLLNERETKLNNTAKYRREHADEIFAAKEAKLITDAIKTAEGDLTILDDEQIENLMSYRQTFFGRRSYRNRQNLLLSRPDLIEKVNQEIARRNQKKIDSWIAGESGVGINYNWPVYLRVKTGKMETSKGVTVPLEDAQRAFEFVIKHRETGWHRNGASFKIGEFQLDSVTPDGVIAGCHCVSFTEIERFAKSQGWITA